MEFTWGVQILGEYLIRVLHRNRTSSVDTCTCTNAHTQTHYFKELAHTVVGFSKSGICRVAWQAGDVAGPSSCSCLAQALDQRPSQGRIHSQTEGLQAVCS